MIFSLIQLPLTLTNFHQSSFHLHYNMIVSMWYGIPSWQRKWAETDGSPCGNTGRIIKPHRRPRLMSINKNLPEIPGLS